MESYNYIIDMYKAKTSLALQFEDNIVGWSLIGTIFPFLITFIFGETIKEINFTFSLILIICLVMMIPITLIYFSHLKYKEYNYNWKECLIKASSIDYLSKNKSNRSPTYEEVARHIQHVTCFEYDEIMVILIKVYPPTYVTPVFT